MFCSRQISLTARLIICSMMLFPQAGWLEAETTEAAKTGSHPFSSIYTGKTKPLKELEIPLIEKGPMIDRVLNDPAWDRLPLSLDDWLTYNPLYGSKLVQQTQVWAIYDRRGLYFAFRCMDPEPAKIKSSIGRRDMIWKDDWIGVSLDSLGSHQSAYEFFVNPNGIQGDILNSSTAGQDTSPDWVWESAAKRTEDGYTVEMRIPFKSIRFSSGREVRMEILFWRRVSRLGMSASWPDIPPGKSIFTRRAPMLLRDVDKPLTLEVLPNATYSLQQMRTSRANWADNSDAEIGITAKYGITSSLTLDGTFHPDFSQVESDAFQMEVNQRYPSFYTEKRPFFMEGMGTFDLSGTGTDSNMRTAVHTRRIADPLFGAKITGTIGKVSFASLSASDQAPGNVDESSPLYLKKKYFNVARVLYSLGKDSYVGGLMTDTELAHGYNRVIAGDISLRFRAHHQLKVTAIATSTQGHDELIGRRGMAGQVYYAYKSKRQTLASQIEHYDRDFRMDTAFYNRTGITTNWTFYARSFYPDENRYAWIKKLEPFIWTQIGRDRIQGGNEHFLLSGIRMYFTRQGSLRIDMGRGMESWAGRAFNTGKIRMNGNAQLFTWLHFSGHINFQSSIYYDPINPFLGYVRDFHIESTLQPTSKLNFVIGHDHTSFNRASNGKRVFAVDIVNMKIAYQFNKNFFVRAIERYDNSRRRLLMDYLASFELVPGTVAHAGYGALFEKDDLEGVPSVPQNNNYVNTQRGFFLKISYLYRF